MRKVLVLWLFLYSALLVVLWTPAPRAQVLLFTESGSPEQVELADVGRGLRAVMRTSPAYSFAWLPAHDLLVYSAAASLNNIDLYAQSPAGTPQPLVETPAYNERVVAATDHHVIFTSDIPRGELNAYDMHTGETRTLLTGSFRMKLLPESGVVAWSALNSSDTLLTEVTTGEQQTVRAPERLSNVITRSPDGDLLFVSATDGVPAVLVDGALRRIPLYAADNPAWSPDGTQVVFSAREDFHAFTADIYLSDADGTSVRPLVRTPANETTAVWSPDGTRVAFLSATSQRANDVYIVAVPGGEPRRIALPSVPRENLLWSPDGRALFYIAVTPIRTSVMRVDLRSGRVRELARVQRGGSLLGWW